MGRGRPTKFSKELGEKFFDEYVKSDGTIEKASKAVGIDFKTFYRWTEDHPDFCQLYARARKLKASKMFEEIVEISDDLTRDKFVDERGDERPDHAAIARARLRVDTRKWIMSKVLPKLYGDDILPESEKTEPKERPSVSFVFSDKPTEAK
jgi:hypothetical protein